MNLSMKWLNDYVSITGIKPREYSETMTMSGSKVEGYSFEGDEIKNVVVGKILEISQHPNANSLLVCKVDVGEKIVTILTGAKNLKAGDIVPAALNGSVIAGSKEISTTNMRGVESEGMLCSLAELGLTINDFPYAIADGIFVLQEDCQLGQAIQSAIGLDDTIVEFEITSNRPDCLSVSGLARETACTYKKELKLPYPMVSKTIGDINDILKVEVLNPTLCPRYVAMAVTNVKIGPSPRWMRERLRASGVRPINNIVDITNFVMLEYCQPMHAFDINTVKGGKLIIRNATDGEVIKTLDDIDRTLSSEMLVIADGESPSAVAGVMGGELSGIHDDTVTVVFESANFLGSSVRTTAKKLGMRTEASSRFEKGLDPNSCMTAAIRACQLVEILGIGDVLGSAVDVDNSNIIERKIALEPEWINSFLGINVSVDDMRRTLTALDFKIEGDYVIPPSFRADVEHKADVSEEIARFYGYNIIPSTSIKGSVYGKLTRRQQLERLAVNNMIAQGMNEVCTYTFLSPKALDKVCIPQDSPLRNAVKITNPLGEDSSVMRTCVFPSMMEILSRNYNNRNPKASLFEIAKYFVPRESVYVLPEEKVTVTLGMYGEKVDYYSIKGVVESLLTAFGITDVDVIPCASNPTFHPGRCAIITKDGVELALIGEAHPLVQAAYDMDSRVYLARIDFDYICSIAVVGQQIYKSLPKYPASSRDIAVLCDDSITVLSIEKAIRVAAGDILEKIELFDCYKGAQIPEGKKSLAFALLFRSNEGTLTEGELTLVMEKIFAAVALLGAQPRG